jgi:hypothetical protein
LVAKLNDRFRVLVVLGNRQTSRLVLRFECGGRIRLLEVNPRDQITLRNLAQAMVERRIPRTGEGPQKQRRNGAHGQSQDYRSALQIVPQRFPVAGRQLNGCNPLLTRPFGMGDGHELDAGY